MSRQLTGTRQVIHVLWITALAAAAAVWLWWQCRPRVPACAGGAPPDPYAAQVAEFRRAVSDWSRG